MHFPMSQEGRSANKNPNIVVFGQKGSGKSSLINMLADKNVAEVSSAQYGGTITTKSYDIPKEKKKYTFLDTCGLNEGEKGEREAASNLVDLLKGMSISLVIYIARGNEGVRGIGNKDTFSRIRGACGEKVPILLVVTGLEEEREMDGWWTTNKGEVEGLELSFKGHACVTTKGTDSSHEKISREKIWNLVVAHCKPSHNIILFGESGAGKSSIVNMIVGEPVARVSSSLVGCTFEHERFETTIGDAHFNIFDTAGLNEGEQGRVPHWQAIHKLYTLIRSLNGVSLLVYCMRGRIKENAQANWVLFHKVLCAEKVPVIAVETGLEHEEDLEGRAALLKKALKEYGMVPKGVACIVSVRGRKNEHEKRYNWSQTQVQQLITTHCKKEPWTTDDWISQIYTTTYTTKLCLLPDVRVEFAQTTENVVDKFIEETGMKKEDSAKLKSTLLDAEKKLRKKKTFLNIL